MNKSRTYIDKLAENTGKSVMIKGWVETARDQGKLMFLDFKDMTGVVQGVILPKNTTIKDKENLREGVAVVVEGVVNARPEKNVKKGIVNGDIELEILDILILNTCDPMPMPVDGDTREVNETTRLQYRWLDMRSERMQKNIKNRFKVQKFMRNFLIKEDFIEIETPILSAPTPEGARSYVVPSRIKKGKFYSLPQSPQQYKQMLMVAQFEKYFQFARCMRDEDSRGDRQPEFTQLDLEMSFVDEEEVMEINEKMIIEMVKEVYPQKKIQEIPFPRISYKEAMEKYSTDRPDLRKDKDDKELLSFVWVVDFPMFEKADSSDNEDKVGEWTFTHNPFSKPKDEYMDALMQKKDIEKIIASQYDIVLNGAEIGGGSIRNHKPEAARKTFEIMGYEDQRIKESFGKILDSLKYGAPPHGGIAFGFDRLMMILENEKSIREVIPFSKTSEGIDATMDAPGDIGTKQKKELGL